jgi:hypothetical protein
MDARRLIAVPVVALTAALLVGAIIDSGQRARMARAAGPEQLAIPADPSLTAEARRIRQAADAAARCSSEASCSYEATAARVRREADAIDGWPIDRRFQHVRDTLRAQLLAEAAVLDQRAADAVDGRSTYATRARLRSLEQRHDAAILDAARAQRAAGLMTRPAYDALVDEVR